MIEFNFETDFDLTDKERLSNWIERTISEEGYEVGDISYVFCDDDYLHKLNMEFLKHDTLTDIISFDYCMGRQINGEIFISVDRVRENAEEFGVSFEQELYRVMIHGILHYCGYGDKTDEEERVMRKKEDGALANL